MLDDLLPLLQAIQPAELNATLNALATALEGRGDSSAEPRLVDGYLTQLNPSCPTIKDGLTGLTDVVQIYGDAAPDLVRMLRNLTVTANTVRPSSGQTQAFFADAGLRPRPAQLLEENDDRIIRLGGSAGRAGAAGASTRPEYPCLLQGVAAAQRLIGDTFANGGLHITLEVTQARKAYVPDEEPA